MYTVSSLLDPTLSVCCNLDTTHESHVHVTSTVIRRKARHGVSTFLKMRMGIVSPEDILYFRAWL